MTEEPINVDPNGLAQLIRHLYDITGSLRMAVAAAETYGCLENVKPAVVMAAVRELEVCLYGQPQANHYRRLICSGRIVLDGDILWIGRLRDV